MLIVLSHISEIVLIILVIRKILLSLKIMCAKIAFWSKRDTPLVSSQFTLSFEPIVLRELFLFFYANIFIYWESLGMQINIKIRYSWILLEFNCSFQLFINLICENVWHLEFVYWVGKNLSWWIRILNRSGWKPLNLTTEAKNKAKIVKNLKATCS